MQEFEHTGTIDGLRTAGAPGNQLAGTGVQRLERRPAWPALGFDPNLPAQRWRVVGTWVETRGGHAPEGATFEGRHDPAVYMGEPTLEREQQPPQTLLQPHDQEAQLLLLQPHDREEF